MISIIIPTYRPENYFFECIHSVIEQNIEKSEYEIIIVLNGDKQPYERNIKSIIKSIDANIKYIYTSIPGVSNARNIGLEYAKGEYIYFLDDDDILSENYFEHMLKMVTPNSIVASNVYSFYNSISEKMIDYLSYKGEKGNIIQNRKYLSNACCKLIPRKIIGNKEFNPKFKNGEDALFMFSISDKIDKIIVEKNSIYYRRLRVESASRKKISLWERFIRISRQQIEYTKIYFTKPFDYNFILYLTRLLAVYKQ